MDEQTDAQLLREYARRGDETAFRELVARHADFVYSAALRQVRSPDLAGDITQSVFIDLARKAKPVSEQITAGRPLLGWLHRGARYAALTYLRDTRRRLARESEAMELLFTGRDPAPDWDLVQPALDEALDALSDDDREALFLRYFKNQNLRAVGLALGVTDDTAQKRVNRALERLRVLLAKRGVAVGATGLAAVISANAIQAAPAGLAAAISTAAVLAGSTVAVTSIASTTLATAKIIAMTALHKSVVTVGAGTYEARRAWQLYDQTRNLQAQQSLLAARLDQLNKERNDAASQLAALLAENNRLRRDSAELVQLRAETKRADDADDPYAKEAKRLADRARLLRQRFEQWPGKKTLELQLLTEQDWLNAASRNQIDTDAQQRQVMHLMRNSAKWKFAHAVQPAIDQFAAANNGQLPTDPSQLAPYLQPPLDSFLGGYQIAQPGWEQPSQPNSPNAQRAATWALVDQGSFSPDGTSLRDSNNPLADPDFDWFTVIYQGGSYTIRPASSHSNFP